MGCQWLHQLWISAVPSQRKQQQQQQLLMRCRRLRSQLRCQPSSCHVTLRS
jgi:hypothetical protein